MEKDKYLLTRYALLKNIDIFTKKGHIQATAKEILSSIRQSLEASLTTEQKDFIASIDQLVKEKLGITEELSTTVIPIFKQLDGQKKNAFTHLDSTINDWSMAQPTDFDEFEMLQAIKKALDCNENNLQELLTLTERYWSACPFYKDINQDEDVSLFDYSKLLASIVASLVDNQGLLTPICSESEQFLLLSMDMSGVQDFIYNISGEKALKSLRARSFYLEVMLEYLADVLLERFALSRINVIYTGGGHANLLLANTPDNLRIIDELNEALSEWFMHHFKTDLSVVIGTAACSFNALMNEGDTFKDIWRKLGQALSEKKSKKYGANQIIYLNQIQNKDTRECKECLRSDVELSADDRCSVCEGMIDISNRLLDNQCFIISNKGILELPFNRKLNVVDEKTARKYLENEEVFVLYSKQDHSINEHYFTQIWMGDYDYARLQADKQNAGIASYAKRDKGISRLGVLRADVDNLGATFLSGIPDKKRNILRTAILSRAMSKFFKKEVNDLLKDRKISIIYSGGDDLFFIGAWDDIIFASIEIRKAFQIYTLNKLSFSAGIGIYTDSYPVSRMAYEVGKLEDRAKEGDKDQVCLWMEDKTFSWIDLDYIIQEKYNYLLSIFNDQSDEGNTFLYNILYLLRGNQTIQLARFAYFLARANLDRTVTDKLYSWIDSPKSIKEFVTAIELYVYTNRSERNGSTKAN